ncbi:hypothetical protein Tco_1419537 [Tanacetum coccineum]
MEEDQAGPNPGQSHVALAGPNLEPMHDDFIATAYPRVHESLKHTTKEHVHLENPLSLTRTLSSMKSMKDNFTFGDQFINDKSTEEDPGKTNMETEVESMVTVPIHQASSSVPPLSTPVIDLTPPKLVSSTKNKVHDQTAQTLSSKIFTLENHYLYSKIDKYINENVKEVVQDALKDPVRESFRELLEFEMKEILRDRMEEFIDAMTKSRKGRRDDQDPPLPPSKGSDQSKKTRHDSDASGSKQTLAQILRPKQTPELDRVIPPNDLPEPENNWAESIAKSYQDPEENKLLRKIGDMGSFIKCAPSNRRAVMSHMKILSAVSLKTYSRYGYTYLKEIILRRADYKEYKILESDFKNLHPNDFEDMYLLHLQGKLNHMSGSDKVNLLNTVNLWIRNIVIRIRVEDLQLGIESYQTKLNLTEPSWDATDFLFKEDYTIVSKPMAVIYRDRNNQKKMMRETEVHKFSDGMLTRILEKLDHMVKDFRLFKYNPGMENRIWSEDDKRRSKEFMEVIERRLKIRRIFRNLKSFVSGRLRDVDYRLIQRTE